MSGAERQRRYRRRRRHGLVPLQVAVDEVALGEALIEAGLLHPGQAEDRAALQAGLERLLARLLGA